RAELQTAYALGVQLLALAQQVQDPAMLAAAHRTVGATRLLLGDPAAAHAHFRQGIALYDAQEHRTSAFLYLQDTGVSCRSCTAWTSWLLGYPAQGRTRSHAAVRLAQQIDHPFNLCVAFSHAAMFHQCRQEVQATQERAAAALRLATEQGFPLLKAISACLHGWSLGQQG